MTQAADKTNHTTLRASIQDIVMHADSLPLTSDDLGVELDQLPAHTRMEMASIARQADTAEAALEPIIAVLVSGSDDQRAAVTRAFRSNQPLREQWERAFQTLRSTTT